MHGHVLVVLVDVACVCRYSASGLGVSRKGKTERTTLFRRAEIRDLAHSVLVDQDVVRLHVPMQDAEAVQVLESVQDLECEEANDVFLELEIWERQLRLTFARANK